jgi:amino acid transporter
MTRICLNVFPSVICLLITDVEHSLTATGNAAQSPFVIAINRAGIKSELSLPSHDSSLTIIASALPHIINAGVFTSAFSAGNSFLFCSSRILYGLSLRGQAPRYLTYCTKSGLPLAAILTAVSNRLHLCHARNLNNSSGAVLVAVVHECL